MCKQAKNIKDALWLDNVVCISFLRLSAVSCCMLQLWRFWCELFSCFVYRFFIIDFIILNEFIIFSLLAIFVIIIIIIIITDIYMARIRKMQQKRQVNCYSLQLLSLTQHFP